MDAALSLELPLDKIREYCAGQPILRLSVFGSAARGELRPESDIDILAEYAPGATVTLLTLAGHEIDLGELIGRKVDLRLPGELAESFQQQVAASASLIYEEGANSQLSGDCANGSLGYDCCRYTVSHRRIAANTGR